MPRNFLYACGELYYLSSGIFHVLMHIQSSVLCELEDIHTDFTDFAY